MICLSSKTRWPSKKKSQTRWQKSGDILETTVVISARPTRDRDRRPSREKVIYLITYPARYKYRGEAESLDFPSRKYATTLAREKSHRARAFFSRVFISLHPPAVSLLLFPNTYLPASSLLTNVIAPSYLLLNERRLRPRVGPSLSCVRWNLVR